MPEAIALIHARLERIEQKLDTLLARSESFDLISGLLTRRITAKEHAKRLGISLSCLKNRRRAARIKLLVRQVTV